ncbi:hypothetical protein E2320_004852 [Naja naja]|nr:hypothetical protein E2320_004852 [Naja naja]
MSSPLAASQLNCNSTRNLKFIAGTSILSKSNALSAWELFFTPEGTEIHIWPIYYRFPSGVPQLHSPSVSLKPNIKQEDTVQILKMNQASPLDILELGIRRIEARIWIVIFNYWLKLLFNSTGLTSLINRDNFQSTWRKSIREKLAAYHFSNEVIQRMGYDRAKKDH